MLSTIVDPLRRILSSAQDMYFDGTVDGPKPLEPVGSHLLIDVFSFRNCFVLRICDTLLDAHNPYQQ